MSVEIALQSTLVSGDHSGALPNVASCAIHVKATFGRQCPSNHSPHSCYTDNAHAFPQLLSKLEGHSAKARLSRPMASASSLPPETTRCGGFVAKFSSPSS